AMEKAASASYHFFLDTVKAAVEEGSVQGSVDDVAVAALSAVHGLSTLLLDGPVDIGQRSPDKLARVVLFALGAGVNRPTDPARPQRH
ncbi:MAG: hypothetical protein ACXVRS_11460, partial [Gaiellaceae bacterium]